MASKPLCPTWYLPRSHTLVARGHVCPLLHCELCEQDVLRTEYEDHILAHQLEAMSEPSMPRSQRGQRQPRGPVVGHSMRVPPDMEQMLAVMPPELQNLLVQLRQRSGPGPATIVIRQRLGPGVAVSQVIGGGHHHPGHGLQSSTIDNLPTTTYRRGGQDLQCVICITDFRDGEQVRTLPCFHKFHKDCIDEWLARDNKCPVCKQAVTQ